MSTLMLSKFPVQATIDSNLLTFDTLRPRRQQWNWLFEFAGGSGVNQVTIDFLDIPSPGGGTAADTFSMSEQSSWRGPRVVTDDMIDNADGNKFKVSVLNQPVFSVGKVNFVYSGAGDRIFHVTLWITGVGR